MNYNITAYIIYTALMLFIIYQLGRMFHQNGRVFILALYNGNVSATDSINNLLLVAYYVFNTGYTLLKLKNWQRVEGTSQLLASLSGNIGLLVLLLALLHYMNMTVIWLLSKRKKQHFNKH